MESIRQAPRLHPCALCAICNVTSGRFHILAKGQSGRLVIEVDPAFKRKLYSTLASDGLTLKAWFVEEAQNYIGRKPLHRGRRPSADADSKP